MRSATPEGFEGHCLRCLLRQEVCLCDRLPRVETAVRFVIVRHIVERLRTSNTGRLAALALPNSEILEYGDLEPLDESRLSGPDTWLLYPVPSAAAAPQASPPKRLIVLDGTWRQSRKMFARLDPLRGMPCLALSPGDPSLVRLRRPPREDGMSTLEAIATAVAHLEGEEKARKLLELHDAHVQAVVTLRGYLPS
ncbi:MAG: DTW domain-containing protein [Deltaproteobacteria bacterium]|nr:DTW domain-containing protein [Deltaproteobacteria bacterium]